MLGVYGENDERIDATLPDVAAKMEGAGKTFTYEVYPGTGHGFLKPGRQGSDGPQVERAWDRILQFYRARLELRDVILSAKGQRVPRRLATPSLPDMILLPSCCYQGVACSRSPPGPTPSHPVHDALHYDITLVPSDTGTHVLGEVQTTWRLRSSEPVEMELDSAMRVVRVLVDGKPNTRLSRTMYARSEGEIEVPHEKQAGDTLSTRVRYHGFVGDGLIIGKNQYGDRTIFADNWPDRAHLWLASQDHPSDKATVAFHVQAPLEDQVIANGVLEKIDTLA